MTDQAQLEVWAHFQTENLEVFSGAKNRLNSLLRRAERLTKGRSLLNIGCGDGYLETAARQRNWRVLSVDPDPNSVERLRSMGIDARRGLIESIPISSESVDVVVCTEVLEHLASGSLQPGLEEIRRVLVPGGVLIGTVPYREHLTDNEVFCPHCHRTFHRWGHHDTFDEEKMRSLLAEYFMVIQVRGVYFSEWKGSNWKQNIRRVLRAASFAVGLLDSNCLLFVASRPPS